MHETSRTMTVPRGLLVLAMLTLVGVATISLRAETAKAAHRVQRLHQKQIEYREKLWALQMDLGRLRSPDEIRQRAATLGLNVVPPTVDRSPLATRPAARPARPNND